MTITTIRRIELFSVSALVLSSFYNRLEKTYFEDTQLVFHQLNALKIAKEKYGFDFWLHHFLPIAILCIVPYLCWLLVHFYIVPKWFEEKKRAKTISQLILVLGLIALSIWLYLSLYLRLDFRYCYDPTDNYREPIGVKVLPIFRKLIWAKVTIFLAFVLVVYEILSRIFYKYYEKVKVNPDITTRIIFESTLGAWAIFVLLISNTIITWVSYEYFSYSPHYLSSNWRDLLYILYIYVIHTLAFYQIVSVPKNERKIKEWLISAFIGIAILLFFQRIGLAHYLDFVTLCILPISAFGTAVVRYIILKPNVILTRRLSQKQAELASLKEQINPHFLFNAMNTLYATALMENAEKTSTGIQQLAEMMRFMMHENNQELIDIKSEVQYLRNYIDLQRLRLVESEKLDIKIALDDTLCIHSIAPMLLVPFVENAFKHGISLRNFSWIHVKLYCQNARLHFSVFNSIHPQQDNDPEKYSSGIGLVNVQKRLNLLYPTQHQLTIHKTDKEFSIILEIDFKSQQSKLEPATATYNEKL